MLFSEHDSELRFEIGLMFGKRDLDRAAVRKERGRRLEPDQRRAERRALHLLNMIGVVQAHRDELARRDRQIDLEIASGRTRSSNSRPSQYGPLQDVNGIAAHFAVEKFAV